jgi:hypothetical protein
MCKYQGVMGLVNVIFGYLLIAAVIVALTAFASHVLTTAPLREADGPNANPDRDK